MINYNWTVTDLLTIDNDSKPDYVVFANFKIEASEGDYSSEYESLIKFSVDEGGSFIPYQSLTEEIVLGWIKDTLSDFEINGIYTDLANQISFQKNPPVTPKLTPLPWG